MRAFADAEEWKAAARWAQLFTTADRQAERVYRAFEMFENDRLMRRRVAEGTMTATARHYELRAWASHVRHAGIALGEGGL